MTPYYTLSIFKIIRKTSEVVKFAHVDNSFQVDFPLIRVDSRHIRHKADFYTKFQHEKLGAGQHSRITYNFIII
jgi:hypothetical protein